jgi:hypothetical protein
MHAERPSTAQTYGCVHSIGGIGLGSTPTYRESFAALYFSNLAPTGFGISILSFRV